MPWKTLFDNNTTLPFTGSRTAIMDGEVVKSRRVDTDNPEDVAKFKAEINALLLASKTKKAHEQSIALAMEVVLNGTN